MDAPDGFTQEEGHKGVFFHLPSAVLALIFLSREEFGRSFPSSTAKSNFVYPRHNRSPLGGHDVREKPSSCDCAEIRTHVPTSEGDRELGQRLLKSPQSCSIFRPETKVISSLTGGCSEGPGAF